MKALLLAGALALFLPAPPSNARDLQEREEAFKRREAEAAVLAPALAKDKTAACREYARRLDDIRARGRRGGDARYMEHLNELRRRIESARFSAGC